MPDELDALIAAPEHHTLLLENDQVRVLRTRIAPGERTAVHTHCWPSVYTVLSWSDFIRYDADGNVLLDSRTLPTTLSLGSATWSEPLGPHSFENVGNEVVEIIAVELKSPAHINP